jgi:CRISPR-associated protein Cmr3
MRMLWLDSVAVLRCSKIWDRRASMHCIRTSACVQRNSSLSAAARKMSSRQSPRHSAKPTHLAVPAGSVYYFECRDPEAARVLAAALNWHGEDTSPTTIKNRRSTLMGEKGFGLGVCGTWDFHHDSPKTEP